MVGQTKIKQKIRHDEFIKKCAFTLAEVLIVISIIGVIAQMTIPTLVNNVQKQVAVTTLEKTYSDLSQAIRLSEVDNGPVSTWDFTEDGNNSIANTHTFVDNYLSKYLLTMQQCSEGGDMSFPCGSVVSGNGVNYALKNGVGFSIVLIATDHKVYAIIDVNGGKKPNLMGTDVFYYTLDATNGWVPYGFTKGMTRAQIINDGTFGCTTAAITYQKYLCTALIYYDGWKISDDYPW